MLDNVGKPAQAVNDYFMKSKTYPEDPIVAAVVNKLYVRSAKGYEKYGQILTRSDLKLIDWITHLQEELMDAILYSERLKRDINKLKEII